MQYKRIITSAARHRRNCSRVKRTCAKGRVNAAVYAATFRFAALYRFASAANDFVGALNDLVRFCEQSTELAMLRRYLFREARGLVRHGFTVIAHGLSLRPAHGEKQARRNEGRRMFSPQREGGFIRRTLPSTLIVRVLSCLERRQIVSTTPSRMSNGRAQARHRLMQEPTLDYLVYPCWHTNVNGLGAVAIPPTYGSPVPRDCAATAAVGQRPQRGR